MYFQACVLLSEFSPRFSHAPCINLAQSFPEHLLPGSLPLQYCSVIKHGVSWLMKELTVDSICLIQTNQAN